LPGRLSRPGRAASSRAQPQRPRPETGRIVSSRKCPKRTIDSGRGVASAVDGDEESRELRRREVEQTRSVIVSDLDPVSVVTHTAAAQSANEISDISRIHIQASKSHASPLHGSRHPKPASSCLPHALQRRGRAPILYSSLQRCLRITRRAISRRRASRASILANSALSVTRPVRRPPKPRASPVGWRCTWGSGFAAQPSRSRRSNSTARRSALSDVVPG